MNYGTYMNNQMKIELFENVRMFPIVFKVSKVFWHVGVFCIINCHFEYWIRILCIVLYMGTYFKDIFRPQKSIFRLHHAPQFRGGPSSIAP